MPGAEPCPGLPLPGALPSGAAVGGELRPAPLHRSGRTEGRPPAPAGCAAPALGARKLPSCWSNVLAPPGWESGHGSTVVSRGTRRSSQGLSPPAAATMALGGGSAGGTRPADAVG